MLKKENKNNEDKNFAHVVINCEKPIYINIHSNN